MAKKDKQKKQGEFNMDEAQKRMDKYYKACESEKKGKALVVSLISAAVLIFAILFVIVLKMNGVGKTIVFTSDDSGRVSTSVADSSDVSGENLVDAIVDNVTQ